MTVPAWLPQPQDPAPGDPYVNGYKIIGHEPGPAGFVYVTIALPGLRRAVVTIPESSWLNGAHTSIGIHLASLPVAMFGPTNKEAVGSGTDDRD